MEEASFEELKESDLEEVLAIEQASFPTPWTRPMFLEEIMGKARAFFIAARIGGKIVGYGGLWSVLDEAHLCNLAVHPQFRHQHLGTKILNSLIEIARSQKAKLMTLEVRETNAIARALYEKIGFRLVAIRKGYYQDTKEDAYIFLKDGLDEEEKVK